MQRADKRVVRRLYISLKLTLGPSPVLALALALVYMTAVADDKLTHAQAESRLEQLKVEISNLQKDLTRNRDTLSAEQKTIKAVDIDIQSKSMELRELESNRQTHNSRLAALHEERDSYLASLDKRREVLASQILTSYRLGRESRLKLLLNQDSPVLLSRTLTYYDYASRSQSDHIKELQLVLQTLLQMQEKISMELSALNVVQMNRQALLDELTEQRDKRQLIIDQLSSQITSEEQQMVELQRNREDLQILLEKLSGVLADIPANLGKFSSPSELKGRMPIPVNGRVKHAYGQVRTAGLHWQGWLIGAENGMQVVAITSGRVAYSDWLRGYGLLMIIDHGDGIMSLYGNNESLLYEVGDWVEPGTWISTVGSSPQNGSGLYFEIRKDGKAVDPAVWIKR